MSKDVKMFCACDHIVDGVSYIDSSCPKCYDKGYYYDIYFDEAGQSVLTSGTLKLQQEILKILIDKKGENVFDTEWGSDLYDMGGFKNLNINKAKAEMFIIQALDYLKSLQVGENFVYDNFSVDEVLSDIKSLDIIPLSQASIRIKIEFNSYADQTIVQDFIL